MGTRRTTLPWLAAFSLLLCACLAPTTTATLYPREYAGLVDGGDRISCVRYFVLRSAQPCTNLTTHVAGISAELCQTASGPMLALYSAETSRNVLTARVMGPQVVVLPLSSCQVVARDELTVRPIKCTMDNSKPPHTSAMYGLMSGMMPGQYVLNVTLLYTDFSLGKGKIKVDYATMHVLTQTITVLQDPSLTPRNLAAMTAVGAELDELAVMGAAVGESAAVGAAAGELAAAGAAADMPAAAAAAADNRAAVVAADNRAAVVATPAAARKLLGGIDLVAAVNALAAAKKDKTATAAAWGQLSKAVGSLTKTPSKPPPPVVKPSVPKDKPKTVGSLATLAADTTTVRDLTAAAGNPTASPAGFLTGTPAGNPSTTSSPTTFTTGTREPCTYCNAKSMASWPTCNATLVEGSWLAGPGLKPGYDSLPLQLRTTQDPTLLRWHPKGCQFKPLSSLNVSACLEQRKKIVCFIGDSQTKHMSNAFVYQIKNPYDNTKGLPMEETWKENPYFDHPFVQYTWNTWGNGWVYHDKLVDCTDVIFNFGQWPLSDNPTSRMTATKFALTMHDVLRQVVKYREKHPGKNFYWAPIAYVDLLPTQTTCANDLDYRTPPFVDLFNEVANELTDLYGIARLGTGALSRDVSELAYDGTHMHWSGSVGHYTAEYLANLLCG